MVSINAKNIKDVNSEYWVYSLMYHSNTGIYKFVYFRNWQHFNQSISSYCILYHYLYLKYFKRENWYIIIIITLGNTIVVYSQSAVDKNNQFDRTLIENENGRVPNMYIFFSITLHESKRSHLHDNFNLINQSKGIEKSVMSRKP